MKKSAQKGFTTVEVLLVVLVLALLGGVSWYVYHRNHTQKATTTSNSSAATTTTADPYAGWKTATLQYEQVAYRYPANWTITDASKAAQGCVTPGFDDVTLMSPSNHQVLLHTGLDCIGDGGAKAFDTQPVKSLGQNLYLAIENSKGTSVVDPASPAFACLAQTATPDSIFAGTSKHITSNASSAPQNRFCYYPFEESTAETFPTSTVAAIEGAADFKTAKLIFESMQYSH